MLLLDIDTVPPLISAIGGKDFGARVFNFINDRTSIESSILYCFSADRADHVTFGTNRCYASLHRVSALYTEKFFAFDPNRAHALQTSKQPYLVTRTERRNISHRGYLDSCWLQPGNKSRLSLLGRHSSRWWALNLYRNTEFPSFSDREEETLHGLSRLLCSVIEKHLDASNPASDDSAGPPVLEERIGQMLCLTDREREVCRRIVRGLTTEGISLELGIAKTSVATYRQRAYQKLGIATRHELFQLCLKNPPAEPSLSQRLIRPF